MVGGLNWSLRKAAQLGSVSRRPVPEHIDRIAHHCISDGMAYPFVESAFYSYWKGYATVQFPADREILFTPTGGDLDARLRRYHTRDGIDDAVKPVKDNPLLDVESPIAEKFATSLMKRSVVKKVGGFIWKVDRHVVKTAADVMTDFIGTRIEAPDVTFQGLSLNGLVHGVGVFLAVSQIHVLVSILMGKDPTDVSTSIKWPAVFRHRREWLRWFELAGADEQALSALTFDFSDKYGDIAVTPLVPIDDDYLGVVPSVVMRSNWPRNLLAFLARRFGEVYSMYSASKEDRLPLSFQGSDIGRGRARKVQLPEWKGRRLPDIHLEGVVAAVTPSTPHVRVVVDCGFPLVAALTPCSVRELTLVPGVTVTAVFKASAAHLIPYRDYSMISSICESNTGEIVNPSACAVFRFITAWSLVGCSTGRSAGLAPLMILST